MEEITVKGLSFSYPQNEEKVLNDVNFTVSEGEFITICGKSGCGKSTLLKQLKPSLTPVGNREGSIIYKDRNIQSLDIREEASNIGYVFQDSDNGIVTDKVWHELAFGLESLGEQKEAIRLRVSEIASYFGTCNIFDRKISELSGGQKQILNLASVMVMQPSILLLDEPTSQLDPIAARDFIETIKKINEDFGTTIIIVEHRLEELLSISDRVIVMENGRIIAIDTPREVAKKLDNDILEAFPTPVKVWRGIECKGEVPLTVKEGRNMLKDYFAGRNIKYDTVEKINSQIKDKEEIISFQDVWFKYDKRGDDIIKSLDITVYKGEIYSIVGGNGTGKTTTLSLINGFNKPYRGVIKINNRDIRSIPPEMLYYENMVTLPQDPKTLFVRKTVREDLIDMLKGRKIKKVDILERVEKISTFLEINNLLDKHPYDLSGGEQQRVALGKVLLFNPKIILLDEPTKGLDEILKNKLGQYLQELSAKGVTIVIVTHDIEFAAQYSHRSSLFFNGSIITTNYSNEFFSGNSFYTTSANRMSRNIFKNAIISQEVIDLCKKN